MAVGVFGVVVHCQSVLGGAAADQFREEIVPILEEYCFRCHGPEKQKSDLNFSIFGSFAEALEEREVWDWVLERVQADEMPPAGAPEMAYDRRQVLLAWLRDLPEGELDCHKLASDRTQNFYRGYVMSRRLTRAEYGNTLRDLIGLPVEVARLLPSDGAGGEGFDTNGGTLFTSPLAIERYLEAADLMLGEVLPEDPVDLSPPAVAARARLLVATPGEGIPARLAARKVLFQFARRAFRRPVGADEVEGFLTLFDRVWERGDGFDAAVRLAMKAILVSPHFLFLAEPEPEEGGTRPLGAFPLASRISYFLWGSMPDEELMQLAASRALLDPEVLGDQVRRMVRDPKAAALGERFAMQWLGLESLGGEVRPDPRRYPEFDDEMAESMRREVVTYFNRLVREDRSLLELVDSDYTFMDERLASLYGIEGIEGDVMRRVEWGDRGRGGILGMAAVHAATSYPLRTSPVLRGKWILEVILGERVPPPPPGVPALEVEEESITAASLREELERHRRDPECAACHDRMDPLGFGMEVFDVIGRRRSGVDATGVLPSGEPFSGPEGLKEILMHRKSKWLGHFVRKMTGYAFGRELNRFDECVLRDAMLSLEANQYRPSALLETIVTSFPFRHRYYAQSETNPDES